MTHKHQPYIIVTGDPVQGFRIIGPFADGGAAVDWGASYLRDADWWVALLHPPVETE